MACAVVGLWGLAGMDAVLAQPQLSADVFGLTTNARVSGVLDMGEINPQDTSYHLVPYYIRFQFPEKNFTAWGIQLYTNNCPNLNWMPDNGIYGGLRGSTDPLLRIPLYWQSYAEPQANTIGSLGFYANTLRSWGLVKDRNDQDVVNTWTSPGNLAYRTIVGYEGLGDYPQPLRPNADPPTYLYLGMDVHGLTVSERFQTTLYVDLYNLGLDASRGGFATPNPFTPVRGQKTNFNFYLKDFHSTFTIKIYTLRGRLIRTLTEEREWDGRDDNGQWLEGGIYLYQIQVENQRVNGTVVLIK